MTKEQLKAYIADIHISLVEAMQKIDDNAVGILFLVENNGVLCGAVSDGDIRRWILKTGEIDCDIFRVMNSSPKSLQKDQIHKKQEYLMEHKIQVLPIVDEGNHVVDIAFSRDKEINIRQHRKSFHEVPVIIMAGGKGTRLYPYTKILPKPLIPIGDVPIVQRIVDTFLEYGASRIYMTINYRKEMIRAYFSEIANNYPISFVEEDKPLGTAGSIRLIGDKFENPIVVTNCDILIHTDYEELYRQHKESGNQITMVTALKHNTVPYGVVYSGEDGVVNKIVEKPKTSFFVNTGMYVLNPEMLSLIPENVMFHMTDLIEKAIEKGYQVGMYPVSEEAFLDMGEFEEMKRMENKLQES